MNVHKNAKLTPRGRAEIVHRVLDQGQTPTAVATAVGVCEHTGQSNSRGVGWEYLHVCIDDHSRVAFSQIRPDEKKESATAFLKDALAYYKSLGVTVSRVMTDNGACYKAFAFRDACRALGLKHIRTRPYSQRQTERPSASSRPPCANGPMPAPIRTQANAHSSCQAGSTNTTGTDLMVA